MSRILSFALELPLLSDIKMDSSGLIASIAIALDNLESRRKQSATSVDTLELGIIMCWLKAFRTFCICSTIPYNNVELRTEGNNDNAVTALHSRKMRMKQNKSRLRKSLGSLLVMMEDVVHRVLEDHSPLVPHDLRYDMKCCGEKMDKWYTHLSVFLQKYSTSPGANQIELIADSVLENLKDYLSSSHGFQWQQQIEALKKNITVMRNIICFRTLLYSENQEFQCLLTQIEPLAITAAHLPLRLFIYPPDDLTSSMLSALLLKFNHADNPLLREKCTLALLSLKHSRELYDPTLDLNSYPFAMKMEVCIFSLSSTYLKMIDWSWLTGVSFKELQLYERLRLLRTLVKRQPDRFNDDKTRNLAAALVCDAEVRISSSSLTGHWPQCFMGKSEVIWAVIQLPKTEEKVMKVSTFNFPKTDVLGFLDFLLEDYLMGVESSNTLNCVPKIRKHLVILKEFMGKLVKMRNQQENLHEDVWNLAVCRWPTR